MREDGQRGFARVVSRRLQDYGLVANLVEFPAVPKGQARFRFQVMAGHSDANVADAVQRLRTAFDEARAELDEHGRAVAQAAA